MTADQNTRSHCQDRALEWFSAMVMLGWSVVLALPGGPLNGPQFAAFARYGVSETWWAATFGAFGSGRMVALYINGRWPKGPYVRMAGSLFGAVSWAQVSWLLLEGSMINAGIVNPGTAVYGSSPSLS